MTKVKAQPFGWHFAVNVDLNASLDIVRRSHARTHTVLDSAGTALQVYDAAASVIDTEPIVIARIAYPDQDWTANGHGNPDTFVRDRQGYMAGKLHLQYLNEPVVGSDKQLTDMLDHCRGFMQACVKYNVRGSVGAFPDASIINKPWVDAGLFDPFLKDAVAWTRAGHGVINHHQYTYGSLLHGGGGANPLDMTSPARMQPQFWPKKTDYLAAPWSDYLIYRNRPLLDRAIAVAGAEYLWLTGEGFHDDMPNLRQQNISPQIEAAAHLGKLQGPLDQRALWSPFWWPQWTAEVALTEQLGALEAIMPASWLGGTLFACNADPRWGTYNYMAWPSLLPVFYSFADRLSAGVATVGTPPAVPKPANAGAGKIQVISGDYNIRSGPGTNYGKVAAATKGATLTVYTGGAKPDESTPKLAAGTLWDWVEGASVGGWIAAQGQFSDPPLTFGPLVKHFPLELLTQTMNSCGPASLAEAVRYKEQVIDSTTWRQLGINDVRADMNSADGDTVYLAGAPKGQKSLQQAGPDFGLGLDYVNPITVDDIIAGLNADLLSIILYERGLIPGTQKYFDFTGQHISAVNGWGYMSDNKTRYLTLVDTLGKDNGPGDDLAAIEADVTAALAKGDGNNPNQGLIMQAADLIPPTTPPPVEDDTARLWKPSEVDARADARIALSK